MKRWWVLKRRHLYLPSMGVRPPPSDNGDEPDVVTFGIAALDAHLDGAEFTYPVETRTLLDATGDPEIPYDAGGSTVSLSEALSETHFDRFETEQELLNALHPVFEGYREQSRSGFLSQLRSMLPF
jgi:hypothetical protein